MPNVALLPVTKNPDQLLTYIEENFRRIANTFALPIQPEQLVSIPAEKVTAGTFATGNFIFAGNVYANNYGFVNTDTLLRENSLELYRAGGGYIDFHRVATSAEDAGLNFDMRLYNNVDNQLLVDGGRLYVLDGEVQAQNAYLGEYAPDPTYCQFKEASLPTYGILHRTSGLMLINSAGTDQRILVRIGGSTKFEVGASVNTSWVRLNVTGGILLASDWFRCTGAVGIYNETYAIGWQFNSGGIIDNYGASLLRVTRANDQIALAERSIQTRAPTRPGMAYYSTANGYNLQLLTQGNGFDAVDNAGTPYHYRGSAFQVISRASVKKDIRPIAKAEEREKIKKVKPVRFRRRDNQPIHGTCDGKGCEDCSSYGTPGYINNPTLDKIAEKEHVGFLAEEIAEVYPEVVAWDYSNRDDLMSEPIPWGIDYGPLTAILFTAVQDLDARIDALEAASKKSGV